MGQILEAPNEAANPRQVKLFWHTGCSTCMRTKEFLTKRGIDFESINLSDQPERMDELLRFGARSFPIVSRGDKFTTAQDLADVAKFLGIDLNLKRLAPHEFVAKLDTVLDVALDLVLALPNDRIGESLPNRKRTHRGLAHHIFRIPEFYLEVMNGATYYEAQMSVIPVPPDMTTRQIADYGRQVRKRFREWWDLETDRDGTRELDTFYGVKPLIMVLERTTWHSAHHTRQLEKAVFPALGLAAPRGLTLETLQGLPVPDEVYF